LRAVFWRIASGGDWWEFAGSSSARWHLSDPHMRNPVRRRFSDWYWPLDVGGRFGGTASGYMNLASSISGTAAPIAAAWLAEASGTFAAVFWVAAAVYTIGAALWLVIDPNRGLSSEFQ
jgi:hypothetical protein